MGKPERKARESICSSSSYFLRCFGVSRKIHSHKSTVDDAVGQEKTKKTKTRSRWFSQATKFHLKKCEIKTTPLCETEKQILTIEDDKQNLCRVIRQVTDHPLSLSGYNTCYEQQASMTTVRGGKLEPTKTVGSGSKRKELRAKSSRVRKATRVDPVIGILIIMLTLMIMLMWGRLCAILCISTWCYFLPRLKEAAVAAKRKRSGGGKAECGLFPDDLDLKAYKKKIVLEGFLVRQQRRVLL